MPFSGVVASTVTCNAIRCISFSAHGRPAGRHATAPFSILSTMPLTGAEAACIYMLRCFALYAYCRPAGTRARTPMYFANTRPHADERLSPYGSAHTHHRFVILLNFYVAFLKCLFIKSEDTHFRPACSFHARSRLRRRRLLYVKINNIHARSFDFRLARVIALLPSCRRGRLSSRSRATSPTSAIDLTNKIAAPLHADRASRHHASYFELMLAF